MIKRIAHVAVATNSLQSAAEFYTALGIPLSRTEIVPDQKVRVGILQIGDSSVELVEPLSDDSPISKFLSRRGSGLHHICLEVTDLAGTMEKLREKKVRLIDEKPRIGAEGRLIAFVHPASTGGVLVELSQPAAEKSK